MSAMESLEDMLAALEGPSSGSDYGHEERHHGGIGEETFTDYQEVDNLDDFLDSLEQSERSARPSVAPQGAPKRQSFALSPQAAVAPQSYEDEDAYAELLTAPREENFDEASEHAEANWFDPQTLPEYKTAQEAAQTLSKDGYAMHMNKGKWVNYQGGEATDFRIKGTTSSKVGYVHAITLVSLDDYGSPAKVPNPRDFVGAVLTHRQSGEEIQCWFKDNEDATYNLAFFAQRPGTVRVEIKLCGNPMFDIDVQVEAAGSSLWVAKPQLPAEQGKRFTIDIVTEDGSRPEGVAPFEVQSMGDVEDLKLMNNGDGTYKFTCLPAGRGYITIQIMLHGQPIKNSPVTVQVGEKEPHYVKQVSRGVEEKRIDGLHSAQDAPGEALHAQPVQRVVAHAQPINRPSYAQPDPTYHRGLEEEPEVYGDSSYSARSSVREVSNDDLNALLDELGG